MPVLNPCSNMYLKREGGQGIKIQLRKGRTRRET